MGLHSFKEDDVGMMPGCIWGDLTKDASAYSHKRRNFTNCPVVPMGMEQVTEKGMPCMLDRQISSVQDMKALRCLLVVIWAWSLKACRAEGMRQVRCVLEYNVRTKLEDALCQNMAQNGDYRLSEPSREFSTAPS